MVHCAEPPPSPVIRNSFGFASGAPSWIGGDAKGAAVDRWGSTTGAAPTPPLLCHATALADVAAKVIVRQSIARMIKECFTPVSSFFSQPVLTSAMLRA